MAKDTRINVHLHELKGLLEEFYVESHGDYSKIIRELVQGYLTGELMFIDPQVHELLDAGEDDKAIELLVQQLQPLRDRRMRIGDAVSKRRSAAKKNKGLKKAGVMTPEEVEAQDFEKKMKEKFRQKRQTTDGGEDGKA